MDEPTETKAEVKRSGGYWSCIVWMATVLTLYVLSAGPYMLAEEKKVLKTPNAVLHAVYAPLFWVYWKTPLHRPLGMYFHLWRSEHFNKWGGF